jgi:hypothetical protein
MTDDDSESNAVLPGTIAHEALQFLRASSGEVGTLALATGIGRSAKHLPQHLAPAMRAGILARRVEGGFSFWRLGPNSDKEQAPTIGPDEKIVVKVSALAAPSVFAYADQRNAAPFSVGLHSDGRMSIERHGRLLLELTASERIQLVNAAARGVTPPTSATTDTACL